MRNKVNAQSKIMLLCTEYNDIRVFIRVLHTCYFIIALILYTLHLKIKFFVVILDLYSNLLNINRKPYSVAVA